MSLENVHYDAFISYRHCELDMFVAKNLHKTLEAFKLPSGVAKEHPELPRKIERVFRDQEELPLVSNLAKPITEALRNSDNLIVVCTPRLSESLWCQKEIETFIGFHGREHVFAVLAEGEPGESFPSQLLKDDDGNPTEPLGADFRGKSNRAIKKKMKNESLRLLAPMFGLNYDDLRQRHKEQKARRTIFICTIVISLLIAIGIYSTSMALLIRQQANEIKASNEQITNQNNEIAKQNIEIKEKSHDIALKYAVTVAQESENVISRGDKEAAVRMVRDVLPDDKDDEFKPYTPECERALADYLGVYFTSDDFLPYECIQTEGKIMTLGLSEDGKYLFYGEEGEDIIVVDTDSCKEIFRTEGVKTATYWDAVICGHKLFYSDGSGILHRYDIDTGEDKEICENSALIRRTEGKNYIYTSRLSTTSLINADTEEKVLEIRTYFDDMTYEDPNAIYVGEDYVYVDLTPIVKEEKREGCLRVYDVHTGELKDETPIGVNCDITSIAVDGNDVYLAVVDRNDYSFPIDYIVRYDANSGEIVYKTRDSNRKITKMSVTDKDGAKYLFALDGSQPFTFDVETGELMNLANCESYVVKSFDLGNGNEALILENGTVAYYAVDSGFSLDMNYFPYPFNERVSHAFRGKEIFAFHRYESNTIGIYRRAENNAMEKLDYVPEYKEFSILENEIAVPSKNLKFLISSEEFGIYNNDGKCIADFRGCSGYDEANDRLIFKDGEEYYALKMYSYEELLAAADEYLASKE